MEVRKCSSKKHEKIDAINYCEECKIYMCNRCNNYHSEIFPNHILYKLDKDISSIFTGFCKEVNHSEKLEYFCKTHNQLCCVSCIAKIKANGKGQHHDCDICMINEIKEEKKNKLNENIKSLEELSKTLENSLKKIKILLEKINENKENLKLKIQIIFTKIRNAINEREDFLLLEVDKQFESTFLNKNIINQSDVLSNKIKISLEKGKYTDMDWNNENILNYMINNCIIIENNIKEINIIDSEINNCIDLDIDSITFIPDEEIQINDFIGKLKEFGKINNFNKRLTKNEILFSKDNYMMGYNMQNQMLQNPMMGNNYQNQMMMHQMNNQNSNYQNQMMMHQMNNQNSNYQNQKTMHRMDNQNSNYQNQMTMHRMDNQNSNYQNQMTMHRMNNQNSNYQNQMTMHRMNNQNSNYQNQMMMDRMYNQNSNYQNQMMMDRMNNQNSNYQNQMMMDRMNDQNSNYQNQMMMHEMNNGNQQNNLNTSQNNKDKDSQNGSLRQPKFRY